MKIYLDIFWFKKKKTQKLSLLEGWVFVVPKNLPLKNCHSSIQEGEHFLRFWKFLQHIVNYMGHVPSSIITF